MKLLSLVGGEGSSRTLLLLNVLSQVGGESWNRTLLMLPLPLHHSENQVPFSCNNNTSFLLGQPLSHVLFFLKMFLKLLLNLYNRLFKEIFHVDNVMRMFTFREGVNK